MKKIIFVIMLMLMSTMVLGLEGEGTESSPYFITDCDDFAEISNDFTAYYAVYNDIQCDATITKMDGVFTGTLDGRTYVISNLTVASAGFWNYTENATIKNLQMDGWNGDPSGGIFGSSFVNSEFSNNKINVSFSSTSRSVLIANTIQDSIIENNVIDYYNSYYSNSGFGMLGRTIQNSNVTNLYGKYVRAYGSSGLGYGSGGLFYNGAGTNYFTNVQLDYVRVQGKNYVGALMANLEGTNYFDNIVIKSGYFASDRASSAAGVGGISGRHVNTPYNGQFGDIILHNITGELTAGTYAGCFAGDTYSRTGTQFADNVTCNTHDAWNGASTVDYAESSILGYDQLVLEATYSGWDFDTVWEIDEGVSPPELLGRDDWFQIITYEEASTASDSQNINYLLAKFGIKDDDEEETPSTDLITGQITSDQIIVDGEDSWLTKFWDWIKNLFKKGD